MIIIRFKSGFELSITCEKFKFSTSNITGEITNYSIEGIEDNKPLFFRAEDIECIWQKKDALKTPYEWIPCSERLPEDKQVVFVQDTNGTMWIWKYFSENLKYRGPYQWEDENGEWQLIDEVVAWMPLPEPYKEEQHD